MSEATVITKKERPLSPHLQIYRWQWTMAMSISHRITGVGLTLGTLLLTAWLWAAAYDADAFSLINDFLSSIFGKVILFGFSLAFWYHFCNGIRHMIWDTGHCLEINQAYRTGVITIIATIALTGLTWLGSFL